MGYWHNRYKAFGYAFKGIAFLVCNEAHFKIHMLATICVIVAGLIFGITAGEWCAVIICIGAVTMGEAINTAVEKIADSITTDYNPLIGRAKDVAAAAVLLMTIASVAVGLIVFLPYVIRIFDM